MNRKITATAETGEVFTRRTDRTYTHAVYVEITYSDGRVDNLTPSWAGRPDLAERNLKKSREFAARMQGEEVCHRPAVHQVLSFQRGGQTTDKGMHTRGQVRRPLFHGKAQAV